MTDEIQLDHGATPTVEDQRELRMQHGIAWDPPPGFLSEEWTG